MRVLIVVMVAVAAMASPAVAAPLRAVAEAGAGPEIHGARVLFAVGETVFSEPLWGGERVATVPTGRFVPLSPPLADPPPFPVVDPVQTSALGIVTLENGGVWLRVGGRRVEVALPPGADPSMVAVAGTLGVAPVPEGALVVFDLRSGMEVRQVSLGALDPVNLDGLALSAAGDVAATVPAGDGTGVLVWAAAGQSRVRELARGPRLGRVAVAGGRVAYVTGAGLGEGVRVVVVDPVAAVARDAASAASRREVLRGPASYDVTSLSFDGAWVAFSTPSCLFVASASAATIPAGPCSRTVVAIEPLRGGGRVRVACINAPARACRLRASAGGRTVSTTVRRGQARVLSVPRGRLQVRTLDPGGRSDRVL